MSSLTFDILQGASDPTYVQLPPGAFDPVIFMIASISGKPRITIRPASIVNAKLNGGSYPSPTPEPTLAPSAPVLKVDKVSGISDENFTELPSGSFDPATFGKITVAGEQVITIIDGGIYPAMLA